MDQRIQFVISTIENDPTVSTYSKDVALSVNLSSSRLRHLFRTETGQTFGHYLKKVRLKRAQTLLGTTFMSVKEIMHHVGISSQSHFTRDFKEVYGLSPTEYRRAAENLPRFDSHLYVSAGSGKE
jgi:AraC family transcriptional regulator of arabinose operon